MLMGIGTYTQAKAMGNMVDRYGGPLGLAGKLVGLGIDEMEAGPPWWCWFAIGALAGGAATYALRNKIERVVGGSGV
jgi:hypothetical protein